MNKFIIKSLIFALPFVAVVMAHFIMTRNDMLIGDVVAPGMIIVDPDYTEFYTHDVGFEERALVTDTPDTCANDSMVLVMGDSFSMLNDLAFTNYLQHYLPNYQVVRVTTVLNVLTEQWNYLLRSANNPDSVKVFPVTTDVATYIMKYYKRLPKAIVVESADQLFAGRLASTMLDVTDDSLPTYHSEPHLPMPRIWRKATDDKDFYDALSAEVQASHLWMKKILGNRRGTIRYKLDRELFSARGNERDLYVGIPLETEQKTLELALEKQRIMQNMADSCGTNLIFFLCPNKLNLYYEFIPDIKNDKHINDVLQGLSYFDNVPGCFVTRKILRPYLQKGEKDLFLCDDSHWTYKSADITAAALASHIKNLIQQKQNNK